MDDRAVAVATESGLHFRVGFSGDRLFAIQPDLVIGTCTRRQQIGNTVGIVARDHIVGPIFVGRRRSHHVAVEIAAGSESRPHVTHDFGNHGLQVLLQNAVDLEALTGSSAQRLVAVGFRKLVER